LDNFYFSYRTIIDKNFLVGDESIEKTALYVNGIMTTDYDWKGSMPAKIVGCFVTGSS
jgi:hypothetical protein